MKVVALADMVSSTLFYNAMSKVGRDDVQKLYEAARFEVRLRNIHTCVNVARGSILNEFIAKFRTWWN